MKAKTINFQGGTFKKDPLDLSGYNFPLPVSFTDCTFKGAVRIEAVEFESWVDFVGATFEKPVLLKDSTFDGQVDFESARFKESLAIDSCQFKYDVKLDDTDVLRRLHIWKSRFQGPTTLTEFGGYGGVIAE